MNELEIKQYISQIKEFYCITDFKSEIINWKFNIKHDFGNEVTIGHPTNSHKGASLGDILAYSRLPEVLHQTYPNLKIYVPQHFYHVFEYNPHVAGIKNNLMRWGSLGTFGTTIQRTCNVWGVKCFDYLPKIYSLYKNNLESKTIIVGIRSNTAGQLKNIDFLQSEILKLKNNGYTLAQIGMKNDPIIPKMDKYYFNLSYNQLLYEFSKAYAFIGIQNSLYHVAKSIGLKVIGILPDHIDPYFIKLPFLTQCNHLEVEMFKPDSNEMYRVNNWIKKVKQDNKDPYSSHHVGWLAPDSCHLTTDFDNATIFCPSFNYNNLIKALNDEIYPYNNPILWDYYKYPDYWC